MRDIEDIASSFGDYVLEFPHPGGWALNQESCKFLGKLIRSLRVVDILELGSGYSSAIIANELKKAHKGILHSIDNSNNWSMKARSFTSETQLSHLINFHVFKLNLRVNSKITYIFYHMDQEFLSLGSIYDFIVIDGPHHDVGRDGALYEFFPKLKVGGYFFVDDSRADYMRGTIETWALSFPASISIKHFHDIGNGITIIKKKGQSNNEPLISTIQSLRLWIKALRNYIRLHKLKLND
jgi:hypothetical protein